MTKIEKIIKQAVGAFSKPQTRIKFQENLNSLIQNVSQLTLNDVFFDKEFINNHDRHQDKFNPIIYIPVFEDSHIIVSIFVLKSKSVIPLHDHPVMHGILKVLSGCVQIQSYSVSNYNLKQKDVDKVHLPSEYFYLEDPCWLYGETITAVKNPPIVVSETDDCALLTPLLNNIHEVRSYNGPSAFIDILAPPYESMIVGNGSRHCTYFLEDIGSLKNQSILTKLWRHPNYFTEEVPFKGPKIRIEY